MAATPQETASGQNILGSLALGTGLGVSATGLFYLAKKLRERLDKTITENKEPLPDYADVIAEPHVAPTKKIAADNNDFLRHIANIGMPLVGAASGSALAAALSSKEKRKRNALIGAGLGLGAGVGLNTKPVHDFLGANVPRGMLPIAEALGWRSRNSESVTRDIWRATANTGALLGGGILGKKLYDSAMKDKNEREEAEKRVDLVGDARKKYFDALLTSQTDDDKTAAAQTLGDILAQTYDNLHKTSAPEKKGSILSLPEFILAGITVPATVGGGILGYNYMRNKVLAASRAKQKAHELAIKSRARPLSEVWINPAELAELKNKAVSASED